MARSITLLLLALAGFGLPGAAQEASPQPVHLERFAQQVRAYKSLRAKLKLTMTNRTAGFEQMYDGSLEMRGRAYCFVTEELEVWSDGQSVWQYMPVVREVTITEADTISLTLYDNVMRLFTDYATLYKVAYKGEVAEKGRRLHLYHLYPNDLGQPYSQIHILLAEKEARPASIYYRGKDGVDYRVEIVEFEPNASVRDSFAFKPKGKKRVKVIDLRGQ